MSTRFQSVGLRAGLRVGIWGWLALAASGWAITGAAAPPERPKTRIEGIKVGRIPVEVASVSTDADGLPSDDVLSIAVLPSGEVYAGTDKGLARYDGKAWSAIPSVPGRVRLVTAFRDGVLAAASDGVRIVTGGRAKMLAELPASVREVDAICSVAGHDRMWLATRAGLFECPLANSGARRFQPVVGYQALVGPNRDPDARQVAIAADGRIAVAALDGLFLQNARREFERMNPVDGPRSWSPRDVRGVVFDSRGRLWFASPAGAGCLDGDSWSLFTGNEGLPYNDFTALAAGGDGSVWFGTKIGAIRFDGRIWNYRQGRRWLPSDDVRSLGIAHNGDAWFATHRGVGRIERRQMTLAEKAARFEEAIDKYHRRPPLGYVLDVELRRPGNAKEFMQHDSDNDGLWTGMYGAGECFAYAATGDPKAKERARAAFEALRFLSQVTQGGPHSAPKGFPARSVVPSSEPDPNDDDSTERDEWNQYRDPRWKVIAPRWPKSADGKWHWKCDTSSDELDGHFFLYAAYYDLVAATEEERQAVRDVVSAIAGHLVDHDFDLVDHDGKPTRWARFGPKVLNDPVWAPERGLNSLSILSYLAVAEHVTGESRFHDALIRLVKDHGYLSNLAFPKMHFGPGTGNQSDDEMAFMCYYNLLHYVNDSQIRRAVGSSLRWYWQIEQPERNPLFNYIFAASYEGSPRFIDRSAPTAAIDDALDTLKRFPLDRFDWEFRNSHRIDVVRISGTEGRFSRSPRGRLRSGMALPVDERFFQHWNHDAWTLNGRGQGKRLADGASYLLPYYLGRYLGFLIEETASKPGDGKLSSRDR